MKLQQRKQYFPHCNFPTIHHRYIHSVSLQQTCNYGNRKDIHNMRNKGCCIWKTSRELMTFESAYKCTLHTTLVHDDEKLISGIFIQLLRQVSSSSLKHDGASKIEKWEGEGAKKLRWQHHRMSRAKDLWKWQNDCNYSLTRIQKCSIPWTDSYLSFAMTVCFSIGTLKWALEEFVFVSGWKCARVQIRREIETRCEYNRRHCCWTRIASNKIWRTMTTCKLIKFLFVLNGVSSLTYSCWSSPAPTIIIHSLSNVYCSLTDRRVEIFRALLSAVVFKRIATKLDNRQDLKTETCSSHRVFSLNFSYQKLNYFFKFLPFIF